MLFLSAFEDFVNRTVPAVPTLLGRLGYVMGLRRGDLYHHWGLARMHGEQPASEAIAHAHTQIWLEVLRTPLPELVSQLHAVSEEERQKWLQELRAGWTQAVPQDRAGGVPAHLSSILEAIAALSAAAPASTRRAA